MRRIGLYGESTLKYKRRVKPNKVLPADLLIGYYNKDPQTLKEVESWLNKNGLTILFTLQEAHGDESVFLDQDGHIYIGTKSLPTKEWLKKCLHKHDPNILVQAIKEDWTKRKMFETLKKLSDECL